MRRSFFFAMGLFVVLLGAQCLGVEKFVLKAKAPAAPASTSAEPPAMVQRQLTPPEWAPWTLMSSGAVVCLYSFSLYRATK